MPLIPDTLPQLQARAVQLAATITVLVLAGYLLSTVPGTWPLFERNHLFWAGLLILATLVFMMAYDDTTLAFPLTARVIAPILCVANVRVLAALCVEVNECLKLTQEKQDTYAQCLREIEATIPSTYAVAVCLQENGIDAAMLSSGTAFTPSIL